MTKITSISQEPVIDEDHAKKQLAAKPLPEYRWKLGPIIAVIIGVAASQMFFAHHDYFFALGVATNGAAITFGALNLPTFIKRRSIEDARAQVAKQAAAGDKL